MLCTEAEAREKWCYSREGKCVESNCMAWRWDDPKKETGYCGLAGRPYVYETDPTSDRT